MRVGTEVALGNGAMRLIARVLSLAIVLSIVSAVTQPSTRGGAARAAVPAVVVMVGATTMLLGGLLTVHMIARYLESKHPQEQVRQPSSTHGASSASVSVSAGDPKISERCEPKPEALSEPLSRQAPAVGAAR